MTNNAPALAGIERGALSTRGRLTLPGPFLPALGREIVALRAVDRSVRLYPLPAFAARLAALSALPWAVLGGVRDGLAVATAEPLRIKRGAVVLPVWLRLLHAGPVLLTGHGDFAALRPA